MKIKVFTCIAMILLAARVWAQQPPSSVVTDTSPLNVNGLVMGYQINSEEVKAVSDKGDFSRFSIRFYVTNTSSESKIMLYKTGFNLFNQVSSSIVQFDCLNATGARLTSKSALLSARPCHIMADVEDKDAGGKSVHNKRFVDIGYWVRSGETVSATAIMIVPLNQKPDMRATYLMNVVEPVANAGFDQSGGQLLPPSSSLFYNPQTIYNIRNFWKNTYINNQNYNLGCTAADGFQLYSQWQFIPVNGSNYYNIKNRWVDTYLSSDKPGPVELSANNKFVGSMWVFEPVPNSNLVKLRNVGNGTYLNIEYGSLQSTAVQDDAWSARWITEARTN